MLWKNFYPGFDNAVPVAFIKGLPHSDAVLDNRTAIAGSHHQKNLVIYGEQSTVGYCGGMDPYSDRIVASGFGPLHDVHCRVEGPACNDLWDVFQERWNDHPAHTQKFGSDLASPARPRITVSGTMAVQVGRTYPSVSIISNTTAQWGYQQLANYLKQNSPSTAQKLPPIGDMSDSQGSFKPYSFTRGERGIWAMLEKAIDKASRFIYIEDQYLVSRAASAALATKLRNSAREKKFRLIILICHTDMVDLEQSWERRREFISDLTSGDPSRTMWTIACRAPVGGPESYVHSKTWIFDDELAITGSANCSRRSYTEDSECDIGVVGRLAGTIRDSSGALVSFPPFAQGLRCALWAKHLGKTPNDWTDAVATASAWFRPPRGSHVTTYNASAGTDKPSPDIPTGTPGYSTLHDLFWQYVLDPDGT